MSQRPTPTRPQPLSAADIETRSDTIMGGVDIPKFSAEMKAEISPEAAPLWNFVCNHAAKIATGVVTLVVIILAIAAWQWYAEKQVAEARGQMGRILAQRDPAARLAAMEKFLGEAPSSLRKSAQLELAGAAAEAGNWKRAAEAYAALADIEGDSPAGIAARLNRAQILMRLGESAAARSEFLALAEKVPSEAKPALHQQAAEAAEVAGSKADAIASYEAAVAALPPTDAESAAFFRARIATLKK